MHQKFLILTVLLLLNTSLSAMDFNETNIINEASIATQDLQNEFDNVINEVSFPVTEEIVHEINETTPILTQVSDIIPPIQEVSLEVKPNNEINESIIFPIVPNNIIEVNETNQINEHLELNTTKILSCKEGNNSVPDNNCSHTEIQGSSIQGLIIFKTRIKPFCEMNGEQFAKQYMQEDWDDIYHDKEFKVELLKACPEVERRYKDKWTPHLYQFSLEYASDSDAIPEC